MSSQTLTMGTEAIGSLSAEVAARSGQNLKACYQCRRCAAGCPVGDDTGVTPDQLIRMIILDLKEEAMNNLLVWKCVACYTCGTRCPNGIHTAKITETLKHMIKEQHAEPLNARIANFHSAFLTSTSHFGRVNEMEFMGIYDMKTAADEIKKGKGFKGIIDDLKDQMQLGKVMMKRKRMHLGLGKIRGLGEVKRLFAKASKK
ncbi:MAG TPA: 4Fe-4S dicluster domain-containing protein [Dissulfurispiraceae bacterium]|nr:4Fe-4S dicluster domain-containing protein [Dissulfurispiraceae bacterium]